LLRNLEPARFLVASRAGLNQGTGAGVFTVAVKMPVHTGHAPLAHPPVGPGDLTCLEVLANPAAFSGESVGMIAKEEDAPVMVLHVLVGVALGDLKGIALGSQLEQGTASAVAGRDIDEVVLDNRGRDGCRWTLPGSPPQDLAVAGSHASHALAG